MTTPVVISATRLKAVLCERKYFGQYPLGLKQAHTAALDTGSALHKLAEHYQLTGDIGVPESDIGAIFQGGAHLLAIHELEVGQWFVEYEHRGMLPCGTPYVAFLDGGSTPEATVQIVQDIKTTSSPMWALTHETLVQDLQAMFYAWVVLCDPGHWHAPRLEEGTVGPQQWRQWHTTATTAALRWVYFLTKGIPRGWVATDEDGSLPTVSAELARRWYNVHISPLVDKINALHAFHADGGTLDEIDRDLGACKGRGQWCGVGERKACNYSRSGNPIMQIIELKSKGMKMTAPNPTDRMAALRARIAGAAAPAPEVAPVAAPKADATPPSVSAPEPVAASVSAPSVASASETPEIVSATPDAAEPKRRGRPKGSKAPPTSTPGAGINPPEVDEALARLSTEVDAVVAAGAAVVAPDVFSTEQIVALLVERGYAVQLVAASK